MSNPLVNPTNSIRSLGFVVKDSPEVTLTYSTAPEALEKTRDDNKMIDNFFMLRF